MNWRETRHGIALPEFPGTMPWLLAVLLFGVGDVVTTGVGLGLPGVVEADPIARTLIDSFGVVSIVGLKLLAFALCYAIWRIVPRPYCQGVPLGLAGLGGAVTVWNTLIVVTVIQPL